MTRFAPAGPYDLGRDTNSIPRPRMEDVRHLIADMLPEFSLTTLRSSYQCELITVILGSRNRTRFPASHRFSRGELGAWTKNCLKRMRASELFDAMGDAQLDPLQPYTVFSVSQFGEPFRGWVNEVARRLQLPQNDAFSTLWMARGGHVSALHHDGFWVHGRWNLAIAGQKRWSFLPPAFPHVRPVPLWDLNRRYSKLYRESFPSEWLHEAQGGYQFDLGPGQMVTWGREWWHRVEVAPSGLTASISTLAHRRIERLQPAGLLESLKSFVFGEVARNLDKDCPIVTVEELRQWATESTAA